LQRNGWALQLYFEDRLAYTCKHADWFGCRWDKYLAGVLWCVLQYPLWHNWRKALISTIWNWCQTAYWSCFSTPFLSNPYWCGWFPRRAYVVLVECLWYWYESIQKSQKPSSGKHTFCMIKSGSSQGIIR
jgi:hypothetical protein